MPLDPERRAVDDEPRTVPVVSVTDLKPVASAAVDQPHESWNVGATITMGDVSGRSLLTWTDDDLQYTLNRIDRDDDLEVPPDTAVAITQHRRTDGTSVYTWAIGGGSEVTFAGPAYEDAWEAVHRQVNDWIDIQEPAVRAALVERRQDFI